MEHGERAEELMLRTVRNDKGEEIYSQRCDGCFKLHDDFVLPTGWITHHRPEVTDLHFCSEECELKYLELQRRK